MENGRVNHSWCMCVVSHGYCMVGGAGMGVVDSKHAGQSRDVLVSGREMPEHFPCAR